MYVINGIVYADSEAESVSVKDAKALDDMIMIITLSNGERRLFDAQIHIFDFLSADMDCVAVNFDFILFVHIYVTCIYLLLLFSIYQSMLEKLPAAMHPETLTAAGSVGGWLPVYRSAQNILQIFPVLCLQILRCINADFPGKARNPSR